MYEQSITISPNGNFIAMNSEKYTGTLISMTTGMFVKVLCFYFDPKRSIFSTDSTQVIVSTLCGNIYWIRIYDDTKLASKVYGKRLSKNIVNHLRCKLV